ncbi:uncharacterized protein P884DRAFT_277810 [Thermothelomyces heterothallicus CBS 202.75]|uniref:uncharacterized protein n=1 Tax=Thermothelomyces heterothallicus CBS 202.75 TaxID=1149848 RepID=UPI00374350AE
MNLLPLRASGAALLLFPISPVFEPGQCVTACCRLGLNFLLQWVPKAVSCSRLLSSGLVETAIFRSLNVTIPIVYRQINDDIAALVRWLSRPSVSTVTVASVPASASPLPWLEENGATGCAEFAIVSSIDEVHREKLLFHPLMLRLRPRSGYRIRTTPNCRPSRSLL